MKVIPGLRRRHYAARASICLLAAALVVGMVGYGGTCDTSDPPPAENLEIRTWYDLDAVRDNLGGSHILMNDLDSTAAGYEELAGPDGNQGMGWLPIGTESDAFVGSLNGQGYELRDLLMIGWGAPHVGVFGFVGEGGQIEDIGLVNADVIGDEFAGGLVAVCYGTVTNAYFTGSVTGYECAGGLVGISYGVVTNSHSTGSVSGESGVGGLVGWNGNEGTVSNSYSSSDATGFVIGVGGLVGRNEGTVTNSHATGNVTGDMEVGGLVGMNGWYMNGYSNPGTVTNSYSTGNVTGEDDAGGLIGGNGWQSIVSDSYATGNVHGDRSVGGLAGTSVGSVSDSYSTGNVTGEAGVGGLVGLIDEGNVSNSYSTGYVTGVTYVGGLIGENEGEGIISNSYWDIITSGQNTSDGGTGKNTTEIQDFTTFSAVGWNITTVASPSIRNTSYIWNIVNGITYPFLSWQP